MAQECRVPLFGILVARVLAAVKEIVSDTLCRFQCLCALIGIWQLSDTKDRAAIFVQLHWSEPRKLIQE